jgi:preflagellin peptidase FlaK
MASLYGTAITPITTLTNAAVISIIPLFANLARNLFAISRKQDIFEGLDESRLNKIIAVFVGYRAKNPKFSFSIERSEGGHKRVTPGIPYIIYITGGFVIQIIYGDIIINLIRSMW